MVKADERERLLQVQLKRTHNKTMAQLQKQRELGSQIQKTDPDWIHLIENWAWQYNLMDIHNAMMVDVLHQLLKGLVNNMVSWLKAAVDDHVLAV